MVRVFPRVRTVGWDGDGSWWRGRGREERKKNILREGLAGAMGLSGLFLFVGGNVSFAGLGGGDSGYVVVMRDFVRNHC